MATGSSRHLKRCTSFLPYLVVLAALPLLSGCAVRPATPTKKFSEVLDRYPQTREPLQLQLITERSADSVALTQRGRPLTVVVHPAYSLFFRSENRSTYAEAKYDLMMFQLEHEARFISGAANAGNVLVLILPGNYEQESVAPGSYTTYLNSVAGGKPSVYYLYSETSSSGALTLETIVMLYRFVRSVNPSSVLVGGGFIGRCQREFYKQVINYVGETNAYIVPEISSVSPDDVSDSEARAILDGILSGDYDLVNQLIEKRDLGHVRVTMLPEELKQGSGEGAGVPQEAVQEAVPVRDEPVVQEKGPVQAQEPVREAAPAPAANAVPEQHAVQQQDPVGEAAPAAEPRAD